jgi:hypothetical protein
MNDRMDTLATGRAARALLALGFVMCAACTATGGAIREVEPPVIGEEIVLREEPERPQDPVNPVEGEEEVPLAVVESEPRDTPRAADELAEVIVKARVRQRHEAIRDLVSEAQSLLRDVELQYVFTRKGRKEVLRGRPVAFALWSEAKQQWTIAHLEIPRPPVKWRPGGRPIPFTLRTPGIKARHVKGTGAERLMFAFSSGSDTFRVYGRKFPVFDSALVRKKHWKAVVRTAKPIVYLPFTEDTLDPGFVSSGREFLLATAREALDQLRLAGVRSAAFPGELLADVVPPQVVTTLAVIEQTDDAEFTRRKGAAFDEVLSQYGLKREAAYRYSISSAAALGPMQFTNKRGKGTYAFVVRRCAGARLDPNFERGATNLLNAMKAAVCLLDIELSQMRTDIRQAYRADPPVLGIFPVAAYNGGPRNVAKLHLVLTTMRVKLEDLRRPGEQPPGRPVACPCLWKAHESGVRPVAIPRYNNENRWYIEKYQNILGLFE